MKLIMAVSKDGYVARSRTDDMSWTGPFDKAAFKMLTCVGGAIACGSKTWELMPKQLPGRELIRLSTKAVVPYDPEGPVYNDLNWFQRAHPNGWLIGGLTIAVNALDAGLIDQAFICESDRRCFPHDEGETAAPLGIMLREGERLGKPRFTLGAEIKVGDCKVHVYNRIGR